MTTKPDTQIVVRALEESVKSGLHPDTFLLVQEALPLARSIAEQWDGGEAKAALEWLHEHGYLRPNLLQEPDCPASIKKTLSGG